MNPATSSTVAVTFPADGGFDRIGRVAIGGLALRAGVGVAETERLRDAVDIAVRALGPEGRVRLVVGWDTRVIEITLTNDAAAITDPGMTRAALAPLVTGHEVGTTSVHFTLG